MLLLSPFHSFPPLPWPSAAQLSPFSRTPPYAPRTRTNRAAETPSHCEIIITRGNPINGPSARFFSMLCENPGNSAATCFHVIPSSNRRAFSASYIDRVSNRRTLPGPPRGNISPSPTAPPSRKLSGVLPIHPNDCSTTALVTDRFPPIPRTVPTLIGIDPVP